jgi:hypothetical protein
MTVAWGATTSAHQIKVNSEHIKVSSASSGVQLLALNANCKRVGGEGGACPRLGPVVDLRGHNHDCCKYRNSKKLEVHLEGIRRRQSAVLVVGMHVEGVGLLEQHRELARLVTTSRIMLSSCMNPML